MKIVWSNLTTFEGLIIPSKWDSHGQVIETYLAMAGEQNIPILKTKTSLELNNHPGASVLIVGKLSGHKLAVKEFKILNPFFFRKKGPSLMQVNETFNP